MDIILISIYQNERKYEIDTFYQFHYKGVWRGHRIDRILIAKKYFKKIPIVNDAYLFHLNGVFVRDLNIFGEVKRLKPLGSHLSRYLV